VIISYWAANKSIGMPADIPTWYSMWKVVTDAYVNNPLAARGFSPDEQQTRLGASAAHRMT